MRPEDIIRLDFPTARKGFDREAVEDHLRIVAAEVSDLWERLGQPAEGSSDASRRVAGIVEAVERQAAEIESEARAESERILGEAREEAGRIIESARQDGHGHVEEVRARVQQLSEAAAALERSLSEELRASLDRTLADLGRLRTETDALTAADEQLAGPPGESSGDRTTDLDSKVVIEEDEYEMQAVARSEETAEYEHAFEDEEGGDEGQDEEEEATNPSVEVARLAAINMAQNDTPREEAAERLADEFDLEDVDAVLDDAYSRADG